MYWGTSTSKSFLSMRILPVPASTQSAKSSFPSCVALVSQTRSPATAGDDHDLPWIGVFHLTFSVSLHVTGTFLASLTPCPVGPRNCGQSAVAAKAQEAKHRNEGMR